MKNEKIWIVCHYAQQPPLNTMLRYHNWGKELIKRGYLVSIVAASTIHNTEIDIVEKKGKSRDVCDGIQYIYIKTPKYLGNGLKRVINMLTFCIGLKQIKKEKPSIIINCEAYLYTFVKWYLPNIPIITDTVDLWPESIVEYAGLKRTNPLIKYLYHLEKKAYIKSDALIFSMEGGIDYVREQKYANKIDCSKIFHINMGCDISQKDKELEGIHFELGWNPDDFNVVYCGSVRIANQVKQICDAARVIERRKIKDIQFQIYGNGDDLDALKKYVKQNNINNVHFYGRIEKEKIPYILSKGKANLLTYKQVNLMKYGGSQSKLFDYLASGRPIISNARWGYNLIERYDCGMVAESQSARSLSDTIVALYKKTPHELEMMGRKAREVAEMYDQPILVDELEKVFNYVKISK